MRKGADCLSKWVGEAERQLRLLFDEARACQPSIIFFDEIDGKPAKLSLGSIELPETDVLDEQVLRLSAAASRSKSMLRSSRPCSR